MASYISTYLLPAIEKFEPEIERTIVTQLTALKTSRPDEFNMFLTGWNKLNNSIQTVAAPPTTAGRRKRTMRNKQKRTQK
jgi:hypothetical protein